MSAFSNQKSLFKAYDIRGDRKHFTPEFITALSHAFALIYAPSPHRVLTNDVASSTVVIGHDVRHLSREIAECMAHTLIAHGIEVIWLGLVTTPIMAFWSQQYDGHGIIATASHSEGHINGVKWLVDSKSPSSQDIQAIYHDLDPSLASQSLPQTHDFEDASLSVVLPRLHLIATYKAHIYHAINTINHKRYGQVTKNNSHKLTVVIDCLHGATAPFAASLFMQFRDIIEQVHIINGTPNPNFPKGNPDPTESERLIELQHAVITHNADIGLGFDGDGDRLAVIDNLGRVLVADHLLYLLAHVAINDSQPSKSSPTDKPNQTPPSVIFDVKCSHHLPTLIQHLGAVPLMGKTGSSIMRKTLQSGDSRALFAGELSGHFLFNDGYFVLHDDAMYAGLRLLNWLSVQNNALSDIIDALPTMVNTPDVYLPINRAYDEADVQDDKHTSSILSKLARLCDRLQRVCISPLRSDAAVYVNLSADCNDSNPSRVNCDSSSPIATITSSTLTDPNLDSPLPQDCLPASTRLTCIDGIRLDFSNGFGIVRPSNTSHSLTVRFAGNTLSDLQDIQARFVTLFEWVDPDLAYQIAKICPNH